MDLESSYEFKTSKYNEEDHIPLLTNICEYVLYWGPSCLGVRH